MKSATYYIRYRCENCYQYFIKEIEKGTKAPTNIECYFCECLSAKAGGASEGHHTDPIMFLEENK